MSFLHGRRLAWPSHVSESYSGGTGVDSAVAQTGCRLEIFWYHSCRATCVLHGLCGCVEVLILGFPENRKGTWRLLETLCAMSMYRSWRMHGELWVVLEKDHLFLI
jgi:hypothetical protein